MKNIGTHDGRLGLHIHAVVFVPTMALLFAIDSLAGGPHWAEWPLLGWGIGLLAHWWFVQGPGAKVAATRR